MPSRKSNQRNAIYASKNLANAPQKMRRSYFNDIGKELLKTFNQRDCEKLSNTLGKYMNITSHANIISYIQGKIFTIEQFQKDIEKVFIYTSSDGFVVNSKSLNKYVLLEEKAKAANIDYFAYYNTYENHDCTLEELYKNLHEVISEVVALRNDGIDQDLIAAYMNDKSISPIIQRNKDHADNFLLEYGIYGDNEHRITHKMSDITLFSGKNINEIITKFSANSGTIAQIETLQRKKIREIAQYCTALFEKKTALTLPEFDKNDFFTVAKEKTYAPYNYIKNNCRLQSYEGRIILLTMLKLSYDYLEYQALIESIESHPLIIMAQGKFSFNYKNYDHFVTQCDQKYITEYIVRGEEGIFNRGLFHDLSFNITNESYALRVLKSKKIRLHRGRGTLIDYITTPAVAQELLLTCGEEYLGVHAERVRNISCGNGEVNGERNRRYAALERKTVYD